jgi:hypothetical protein
LVRGHGLATKPLKTSVTVLFTSEEWLSPRAELLAFDKRVHEAEDRAHLSNSFLMSVSGPPTTLPNVAEQIFTRYQRLFPRRNRHSRSSVFTAVLARHRALHPLHEPFARACFDHSLDVWQWILRLSPDASGPLQIAALFRGLERLAGERGVRAEHAAEASVAFKQRHAKANAEMLCECLAGLDAPVELSERAATLLAHHERPGDDPELIFLNDADALSFFSLNSSSYINSFGPRQTEHKVDHTVARMSPQGRALLAELRLEHGAQELVRQTLSRRKPTYPTTGRPAGASADCGLSPAKSSTATASRGTSSA